MSRKRQRLVPETLGLKRWRERGHTEADPLRGEAGSARAAVTELVGLFPRGLFEDALPPIALKSQVYSLVPDRTAADRQLKALQEQGEIRIIQLGFDLDAHGIIFTEDYKNRVLKACDGRSYAGAVQKFLASVLPACGDLSFQQDQMTQTFGFRDTEITQLVNAGVLTVRDAGSWWLAVPGAGRFIKYFVKGILPAAQAPSPSRTPFGGSSGLQALPFPTPVPCLLQGARLSSVWFGRPSTGNYSFQSSWVGGHLPRYDSALPTMCMTSLGPSWWTVSPPLLEPSCVCRRHEDSTHHYTSPQSGARGAQECCPVVAETGSPWESLGPGFVLGPWPCKGSGVTAAVYLGSKPVVGFGQRFSALPWKWSQKLCQGHGCCLSYSKVLL